MIVPVYNMVPYLGKFVGGLLAQRFEDFDVLKVDDGSTGGSVSICDSLTKKDSQVIILHHKNGGACSARNHGIFWHV